MGDTPRGANAASAIALCHSSPALVGYEGASLANDQSLVRPQAVFGQGRARRWHRFPSESLRRVSAEKFASCERGRRIIPGAQYMRSTITGRASG